MEPKLTRPLFLLAAILILVTSCTSEPDQPNILWIITDDQRADALACYNRAVNGVDESPLGYVESPSIDRLAEEGVLFVNSYCNSPACAPSRTSMHLGQYPHHNGEYAFIQTHTLPDFVKPVLPEILREHGYSTAMFGKSGVYIFQWGPGQTYDYMPFYDHREDHQRDLARKGFGDWSRVPDSETFWFPDGSNVPLARGTWESLNDEEKAERKAFDQRLDILRAYTRSQTGLIIGGVSPMPASRTNDAYILRAFQRYLEHKDAAYETFAGVPADGPDTGKPLMVHLGFHFPHTPILPPANVRERFSDKMYEIPEFDLSELDRLPPQLKEYYRKMKTHDMSYEENQQFIRDYYAFCAYGDSLVGEAVRAFQSYSEEQGREYLVLIVCGDHGWHLGEQGIGAKFGPYDYSNHTAVLAISSDKECFPPGTVNRNFVEFVDFSPTMLAAAGIELESGEWDYLDGIDLAGVAGGTIPPREYVLGEANVVFGPRAYIRGVDFAFSMRTREWNGQPSRRNPPNKNIKWALETSRENAEMALYDLRVDPMERSNVAYEEEYAELADWFREKLGNIVLGDGRVECVWSEENTYNISNFATGADDKVLDIPEEIIPGIGER